MSPARRALRQVAAFASEWVAAFPSEWVAGFVGIRKHPTGGTPAWAEAHLLCRRS